jgi:hypothetical protein
MIIGADGSEPVRAMVGTDPAGLVGMPDKAVSDWPRERLRRFSRFQKRAFLKAFGSEQMEQDESAPLPSRSTTRNEARAKVQWRTLSSTHAR